MAGEQVAGEELYDHSKDDGSFDDNELVNLAYNEAYSGVLDEMRKVSTAHFAGGRR